jgi:hypothetical protein
VPPEVDANAVTACFAPGIRDALGAAGDLAEARVDANADDGRLDVEMALVPKPGKGPAHARVAAALTPILGAGGGAKLTNAMTAWSRGRGDWEAVSFVSRSPTAGFVARAPVKDAAAMTSSLKGFAELAAQPSLSDAVRRLLPLRAGQAAPAAGVQSVDVPGVGKASVLLFPARPPTQRTQTRRRPTSPSVSRPRSSSRSRTRPRRCVRTRPSSTR